MENILISFECEGKNYKGSLSAVCGAGTHVYYLMIDKFYNARLRLTELHGWQFDSTPKTEGFKELKDFFADVVTAWYQ
ncbi:MAG TPA: hypothetical protein VL854_13450 [Nitrososphaeraceae archaeon]|jgi:hypothetical protein|nr:hypothetical protein [Nitrososphaeraceae archaeon]